MSACSAMEPSGPRAAPALLLWRRKRLASSQVVTTTIDRQRAQADTQANKKGSQNWLPFQVCVALLLLRSRLLVHGSRRFFYSRGCLRREDRTIFYGHHKRLRLVGDWRPFKLEVRPDLRHQPRGNRSRHRQIDIRFFGIDVV